MASLANVLLTWKNIMTKEQIQQIRYHAVCDIAHRWFAFFEGETEDLSRHADIFSEDVLLVHGGTHLLAKGKVAMMHWLSQLPPEKGSHIIRRIELGKQTPHQAEVNMDIGYQAVRDDGKIGGALSEYQTTVSFDKEHNAVFNFLQKTPLYPNPDTVFRDSFAENRLKSFIARLSYSILRYSAEGKETFLQEALSSVKGHKLYPLLKNMAVSHVYADKMDSDNLSCTLRLLVQDTPYKLNLRLNDSAGRWLTIRYATLNKYT